MTLRLGILVLLPLNKPTTIAEICQEMNIQAATRLGSMFIQIDEVSNVTDDLTASNDRVDAAARINAPFAAPN